MCAGQGISAVTHKADFTVGAFITFSDHFFIFFLCPPRFERYPHDGSKRYSAVGYGTVYRYYAYPDKVRPRIRLEMSLPSLH